jgi:protein-L-isoaspartate(D-aspartate) O-methyltransferase
MRRNLTLLVLVLGACSRQDARESAAPPVERAGSGGQRQPAAERREERERLVAQIAERVKSEPVLQALRAVPRHAFVAESWADDAYQDRPLPIGHGQTISQPTVVAAMTEVVAPRRTDKCLEIGTGSGYQAAVLAELCGKVFSIEYLAPLAEQAERALRAAGYDAARVALRTGDGYVGWPQAAPFEVVVVTAAPERVPQPLLDQLALGGRLVIPVGSRDQGQRLMLYRRTRLGAGEANFEKQMLMPVRFVPFLGKPANQASKMPEPLLQ